MNKFNKIVRTYADERLTLKQFEELEETEYIERIENCGNSGRLIGYIWYVVTLVNGDEFSVYTK